MPADAFSDDGESPASINAAPIIVGDHESQRRTWIRKAWEARDDKNLRDEGERKRQIEAYLRAADRIRSSTFTRCNLALVAEARGDYIGAAEHYERELSAGLPPNASEREQFIHHICETASALAFERVGALQIKAPEKSVVWLNAYCLGNAPLVGSVFVKPDEQQVVRVELPGEGEQKKTVAVRAGRTTTLEFQSQKEQKDIEAPKVTPQPVSKMVNLEPIISPDPTWKYVAVGSAALGGAGLAFVTVALIKHADVQSEWEASRDGSSDLCTYSSQSNKTCDSIPFGHDTANAWGYAGLSLLGVAATGGIVSYFLARQAKPSSVSIHLSPQSVQVRGLF